MTYNVFEQLISELNEETTFRKKMFEEGHEKYYNAKDFIYEMTELLIIREFGYKGISWIYWFIYIKLPNPSFVLAFDYSGLPICYDVPSLYTFLCSEQKEDLLFDKEYINFIS